MGIFNKLKSLFFEEVEEDKNENLKDEINTINKDIEPVKDKRKETPNRDNIDDIISERELFKSETTFKFPVIFEEEDFIEEKKINKNKNILDFETTRIKESQKKPEKEEKKIFRVSPIISPVYGILDKNYKKEDITTKDHNEKVPVIKEGLVDFDVVRKKAYGTLSDEIEKVLEEEEDINNDGMFFNLKPEEDKNKIDENNLLYDMSKKGENSLMDDTTLESAEENYNDFGLEYSADKKVKDIEEVKDEDNLFNLIDSMYEDEKE
jgi:hypothetical protein